MAIRLTSLKRGLTVVTLAPEVTRSDMLASLSAAGIIVDGRHVDPRSLKVALRRRSRMLLSI